MMAELLTGQDGAQSFGDLLRPDPLPGGVEPEERVVLCGIGWDRYLAIDQALGEDRPGPRFYYLHGDLEIMTTSKEHERIKKWINSLLEIYFEHAGTEVMPHGQATMRKALERAGAEPDESWSIGEEKEFADLVLEVALTSGGIPKLKIYRRFAIPEVWFWRDGALRIFGLRPDQTDYDELPASRLLPGLDIELLQSCVSIPNWQEARRAFRVGLGSTDVQ